MPFLLQTLGSVRSVSVALALIAGLVSTQSSRAQTRTFDLLTASVDDIQRAVGAGALTYERVVRLYLNRIEAYDKQGPRLNALIEVNPRALEMARLLDEERRTKGIRGPLHGIPIAVKDNIDVRDLPSAGGTLVFAGTFPDRDATVIQRLRAAGAIILAKTNMDELALGSQGLSSLGGQILNPYDLRYNPGGSSGGTAVAVSVAFATLGVATETGFSIRSPATNSGVVGIAPTHGLVSRAGVMPISFTQDRVGVHAKSVADAALLLTYLRGFDPDDLSTASGLRDGGYRPYIENLGRRLAGVRVGLLRDLFRKGSDFEQGNKLVEDQIALMRQQQALVIDGLSTGLDLIALLPVLRVNDFELRVAFDSYLRRRGPASPVKSLADLVANGKYLKTLERRLDAAVKMPELEGNREYLTRLDNQRMIRERLIALMDQFSLDALVYPVKSLPPPVLGSSDSGLARDNPISAITGLPAIVLPVGLNKDGLPFALELLGRPFAEGRLIEIAHAYEEASRRRVVPTVAPPLRGETFPY